MYQCDYLYGNMNMVNTVFCPRSALLRDDEELYMKSTSNFIYLNKCEVY